MDLVCHRCGTALNSPDELFCPHCGAPQLRYEPADDPVASASSQQQATGCHGLDLVSWKVAIVSALLVAVPVGLLTSILAFGFFWVVIGGIATVSLYRRRVHTPPTSRMGWRIGGVLGVLSASIFAALFSLKLVVLRYVLHSNDLEKQAHLAAQQSAELANHYFPQSADVMAQSLHFWISPEGIAVMMLFNTAFYAFLIVLLGAAGGALGTRMALFGPRAQRSSQ
jgi:hypothetical protein